MLIRLYMNRKKRIMMVGESSHIPSGFGNYTREILSRLYKTNKYEIAELSCYRNNAVPKTEPWKIYPVSVLPTDPLYNEFLQSPNNKSGQWRFDVALLDFKPDIVFDIRDFWNFTYQATSPLRPFFKWIIAPTYDSDPPKIDTYSIFNSADKILFHTQWAKDKYLSYNKLTSSVGPVVSDAVDPGVFYPLDTQKSIHKMIMGLPEDAFVIGTVMRNQKRKLIPELFGVIRNLVENNKDKRIILYLHSSFPEQNGWNIPSLILEYELEDIVYLTYRCKKCNKFWPSRFHGQHTKCDCGGDATICSLINPINQHELNHVYNSFDIYIQYAICEGFGIPQVEAASAGIPVITIDHGAMREVGDKIGARIVDVIHTFKENETEANRIYPNDKSCTSILQNLLEIPKIDLLKYSQNTRELLIKNYSWQKTSETFEKIFDDMDISSNLDWNIAERNTSKTLNLNGSESNRDFIYKFIDQVIMDPYLKQTPLIEELILDLDNGHIIKDNKNMLFDRNHAMKVLEVCLNNKIQLEKIRTKQASFSPHITPFLTY